MNFRVNILALSFTIALAVTPFPASADFIFYGADDAKEPTWGGAYFGFNTGYAWSESKTILALATDTSPKLSPGGAFGGGQIGYNWQGRFGLENHVVLGIEADIQGTGIRASASDTNFGDSFKSSLDWFGTLRGRVGYAFSSLTLFYATAGLALGGVNNSVNGPNPVLAGSPFKFDDVAVGFVAGAGAEFKFTPALSFKLEYQFIDLGKNDLTNAAGASFSAVGGRFQDGQFSTIRVGLSYFFNCDEVVPLK
jgi:outer membrane immunogenic protein